MAKNITVFDVETTGLDKKHDRIIQLSAVKIDGKTLEELKTFSSYVIPEGNDWHISEAASEVNGLTDELIRQKGRPAREVFREFLDFLGDDDYLTYNGNSFDIEFLSREMAELGLVLPMENRVFYDSKLIECRLNSNRLVSAYQRYMGKTMEEAGLNAHDALSDTLATAAVFRHQLKKASVTLQEMATWEENQLISPEGSIKLRKPMNGEMQILIFTVGKYRDSDVYDVLKKDPDYLKWWAENVATSYTRNKVREYLKLRKNGEV